jgi:DNA invertase Pin-like site-specific DNA recombinase
MAGQKIGYIRVSSVGQNTARQLEGIKLDEVFEDKVSGKSADRPQLQALLKHVRKGDEVIVHSMDRLARNLADLLKLVTDLTGKGIKVTFQKENLTFTGEDSPMATLMLSIIGAVAAFERSMIHERQLEGIALAKQDKSKYPGRQPSLTADQKVELRARAAAGEQKTDLAEAYGVSRATVYAAIKEV